MSSAEAPEAPAAAAAPAPVVDEIAAEVAATLTLAPPSDAGRERAMTVLPPSPDNIPKKALVKPKFPPEKAGKCTIDGCDKRVMSMTLNVSRYLVLPLPVWGKCDAKHHCRHCLRRVCSEHFKKTPSGYKVCSACLDAGVDVDPGTAGPSSPNSAGFGTDDEEEEGAAAAAGGAGSGAAAAAAAAGASAAAPAAEGGAAAPSGAAAPDAAAAAPAAAEAAGASAAAAPAAAPAAASPAAEAKQ